ncbi:MAG: hypothetical protein M3165_10395 [Actinomycetota bacterium]|nr:hypothetical protein [Actinomycetota bacterium]
MHGLTVRWSLDGCEADVMRRLREYVRDSSHARFSGMEGLRFKTWRAREGEWFEGCYVFGTPADRDRFQREFTEKAASSPGSKIVGSSPVLIEPCEVIAVAEGGAGFAALPSYDEHGENA